MPNPRTTAEIPALPPHLPTKHAGRINQSGAFAVATQLRPGLYRHLYAQFLRECFAELASRSPLLKLSRVRRNQVIVLGQQLNEPDYRSNPEEFLA